MKYVVVQDIKAETKVGKNIYLFDFFFLLVWATVTFMCGSFVHENLRIVFYFFSAACGIFLTLKSSWNKRRRNWESLILFIRKDREVYRPVINLSKATGNGKTARRENGYEKEIGNTQ